MTKKGADLTTFGQEKKGADLTKKGADLTNSPCSTHLRCDNSVGGALDIQSGNSPSASFKEVNKTSQGFSILWVDESDLLQSMSQVLESGAQ